MPDLMKLRLRGDGPEAWRFRIEDAETGKVLPMMGFTLEAQDNVLTLTCQLMVSECNVEGVISIPDLIRQVGPVPESADEWTARTVALVLDSEAP